MLPPRVRFSFQGLLLLGTAACAATTDDTTRTDHAVTAEPEPTEPTSHEGVDLPTPSVRAAVKPRYEARFILEAILERKGRAFDPDKPFPEIRLESETDLVAFQDAIEPQWGFRPSAITNAYIADRNVIYLLDDPTYYASYGRCIDDSLAHELAHYIQVVYRGWKLDGADDSLEWDAIDQQRWFRELYCATPSP